MVHPEPDGCDVDEPEVTFCSFVIPGGDAAGIFELIETAFDQVSQSVQPMIHTDARLAGLSHRNSGQDFPFIHVFPNAISIIDSICQ